MRCLQQSDSRCGHDLIHRVCITYSAWRAQVIVQTPPDAVTAFLMVSRSCFRRRAEV